MYYEGQGLCLWAWIQLTASACKTIPGTAKGTGGRKAPRETKVAFEGHLGQMETIEATSLKTQEVG